MPTVTPTLQGSRVSRKSATLRYHVSGLDATTPGKMWDALFAAGLPSPEDPHERNPDLIVDDVGVTEMVGEHACFVEVTYKTRATTGGGGTVNGVEIELDGSVVSVQSVVDYNGTPIKVIYNPLNNANRPAGQNNEAANERAKNVEGVDRMVGMKTLRYSRQENAFPAADKWKLIGKTNSNNGWVFSADKGLWLCTRISAKLSAGAAKPSVSYEFQGPDFGWERIAAYVEETTGELPQRNMGKVTFDANEPFVRGSYGGPGVHQDHTYNGLTIVRVQGEADFGTFGLPSVYP